MSSFSNLRPLGHSGIMVTPIGLGCWQFSKQKNLAGKFWPVMDDAAINEVVSGTLKGHINWFDTAEVYGGGTSEKALSKALQVAGIKPGEVVIATKWWPLFRFASNIPKTIKDRTHALEPYPIDLYQVHQQTGFSSVSAEMKALAELLNRKMIRSIGVSNFSAERMKIAWETLDKMGIPLASNQVRYSLLDRSIESNGVMKLAKELGITIIAYSPLAQGVITGKFHDNPELIRNTGLRKYTSQFKTEGLRKSLPVVNLVRELAVRYGVTPSQIALNWLIHFHGETVVVIPGATRETHVQENVGAMSFKLSDEHMEMLDKASEGFK